MSGAGRARGEYTAAMPTELRGVRPIVGAVLCGAWALAGGACSSYQDPNLRVTDVAVRSRSAEAMVVEFTVVAENPNEVPLPLKQLTYTVSVDGKPVFSGLRSPETTLRRFGTQELKFPAVIAGTDAPAAGSAWCRVSGEMAYTTPGELAQVLFESDVRRPTVGFVDERSVELGGK